MRLRYKVPVLLGTAVLAAALAGCGGSSDAVSSGGEGQGAGGQAGSAALTITEPADGASVQVPFTIKVQTSEEIGPEDSGKNHLHISMDGKSDEYEVVTTTEYQVKDLTPGEHTVSVAMQHADHSPTGQTAQVKVNVTGSGGSGDTGGGSGGGGGYDYGNGGGGY